MVRFRFLVGAAGVIVLLGVLLVLRPGPVWHHSLPDFQKIDKIGQRKEAFFKFLIPYVEEANAAILSDRKRLGRIQDRLDLGPLGRRDAWWLGKLATAHDIDIADNTEEQMAAVAELLLRVDIIPPSLALAQAALESGWGTSRFAQQGNNLFGIWCYEPGCGIVPRRRPAGATYEVASYRSPHQSFMAYIRALNGNAAYRSLWVLRQRARLEGKHPSGYTLAGGLRRYSEEGERYISKVRGVIQGNQLARFD